MKTFLTCMLLSFAAALAAQSLGVEVSTDSLLMDNPLRVTFSVEGASADDFEAPEFEGFRLVGGPSYSTSMSIINGEVNQSASITYYLEPESVGSWFIPPAFLEAEGKILETEPVEILVVPNPEGIRQELPRRAESWMDRGMEFNFDDFFNQPVPVPERPGQPQKSENKKRKIYKF